MLPSEVLLSHLLRTPQPPAYNLDVRVLECTEEDLCLPLLVREGLETLVAVLLYPFNQDLQNVLLCRSCWRASQIDTLGYATFLSYLLQAKRGCSDGQEAI